MKLDALITIDVQRAFVTDAVSHVPDEVADAAANTMKTGGRVYACVLTRPPETDGGRAKPAMTHPVKPHPQSADAESPIQIPDTVVLERTAYRAIDEGLVATLEGPEIERIGICGIDTGGNLTGAMVDFVDAGLDAVLLAGASGSDAGAETWSQALESLRRSVGSERIIHRTEVGEAATTPTYTTNLRPATILGSLPSGALMTRWVRVPADWASVFPDIPVSERLYGEFETSRPLTPRELEHFAIEETG